VPRPLKLSPSFACLLADVWTSGCGSTVRLLPHGPIRPAGPVDRADNRVHDCGYILRADPNAVTDSLFTDAAAHEHGRAAVCCTRAFHRGEFDRLL
jgi:hypothetical protein